jgi:hypothetical protein
MSKFQEKMFDMLPLNDNQKLEIIKEHLSGELYDVKEEEKKEEDKKEEVKKEEDKKEEEEEPTKDPLCEILKEKELHSLLRC